MPLAESRSEPSASLLEIDVLTHCSVYANIKLKFRRKSPIKAIIPVSRLEKLEKFVAKVAKRGVPVSLATGEKSLQNGAVRFFYEPLNRYIEKPIMVRCIEVEVSGFYKINGWRFAGTVEFTQNGNIIRLADSSFEGKVPEKYRHTEPICEHCHTVRNRKDAYLVFNEETGEFKQVGKNCLREYTDGLDAEKCAEMMSAMFFVMKQASFDDPFSLSDAGCGFSDMEAKEWALGIAKTFGYVKKGEGSTSSADMLLNILLKTKEYEGVKQATAEEVAAVDEYAKALLDCRSEYMMNASRAWLGDCVERRDFALICSFANSYLKAVSQAAAAKEKQNSGYLGEVGKKVTFTMKKARILYTKYFRDHPTPVVEIIDTEGNVIIWASAYGYDLVQGAGYPDTFVITAFVKEHAEYKGVPQTIITRGSYELH